MSHECDYTVYIYSIDGYSVLGGDVTSRRSLSTAVVPISIWRQAVDYALQPSYY